MDSDQYLSEAKKEWDAVGPKIAALSLQIDAKIAAGDAEEAAKDILEKIKLGLGLVSLLLPGIAAEPLAVANVAVDTLVQHLNK